jgi:hypothetical protein
VERGIKRRGEVKMTKSNILRDSLEHFYGDIIEDYKSAQSRVMTESRMSSIFKKANYAARISDFAKVKKSAIKLEVKRDVASTDLEIDLVDALNRSIEVLKAICDSQIALQQTLKAKADKERKVTMKEYSRVMNDVRNSHEKLQKSLHNLDIFYSDWLEQE